MIVKAKTLVTYKEIVRQIGDVFEVSEVDAAALGWNVENSTVEVADGEKPAEAAPVTPPEATVEEAKPAEAAPAASDTQNPTGEHAAPAEAPSTPAPEASVS